MYNWAAYVSPANMEAFKAKFGVETFTYDVYDNNEVLISKLQNSEKKICAPLLLKYTKHSVLRHLLVLILLITTMNILW